MTSSARFCLRSRSALPLALLLACLVAALRASACCRWLALAPRAGAARGALVRAWHVGSRLLTAGSYAATLALDAPGAMLLGVAALLWSAAGAYAATYQRDAAESRALRRLVAAER